jgi:hypothetical protein
MRGGSRVGAGKPSAPNIPSSEKLVDHLRLHGVLHMHRKRNKRYKSGYIWELAFRRTFRCGTDQCLRLPTY